MNQDKKGATPAKVTPIDAVGVTASDSISETDAYQPLAIKRRAVALHNQGISVFTVGRDKIPSEKWKRCMTERMDPDPKDWRQAGIGIACGPISTLLVVDFDRPEEPDLWKTWFERCSAVVPGFAEKVTVIETPKGGRHAYLKTPSAGFKSQKLA